MTPEQELEIREHQAANHATMVASRTEDKWFAVPVHHIKLLLEELDRLRSHD